MLCKTYYVIFSVTNCTLIMHARSYVHIILYCSISQLKYVAYRLGLCQLVHETISYEFVTHSVFSLIVHMRTSVYKLLREVLILAVAICAYA